MSDRDIVDGWDIAAENADALAAASAEIYRLRTALSAEVAESGRLRAENARLRDANGTEVTEVTENARLREMLRDVLEQNDLSCMRASEEISVAEGCPCPNCVAERVALRGRGA